jgi:hypothetical protein
VKSGFFYKQVGGRRQGEQPVYKFDWWKIVAAAVLGGVITWGGWVTRMCQKAEKSEEILDMQVMVLHTRITKVDDRVNDVIWKFFENEVTECEEECRDE